MIIDNQTNFYSATDGHIKNKKSKCCSHQWVIRSGKKVLKNMKKVVKMNKKELKQVDGNKNEKNLGVTMGPLLAWDHQFPVMMNKMKEAIIKLKNAKIIVSTVSICYDMSSYKNHIVVVEYLQCQVSRKKF